MAPENAPSLVILETRIENGNLRGSCTYIEPRTPGTRLRVRWAVETQPEDFVPVGGGVAYIYAKDAEFDSVSVSKDAIPVDLGQHRYRWTEGLNVGIPWVMFILILPPNFTISLPSPEPAGTRIFQDRLALYWVLRGDDIGRTHVSWTISTLRADPRIELVRINQLLSRQAPPQTSVLAIEDPNRTPDSAVGTGAQRNPWISGSFYLVSAVTIVVVLAVLSRNVNPLALPVVLIAGFLLLVVVGALQLRNDEALKDQTFLTLIVETLKRLPLLRGRRGR